MSFVRNVHNPPTIQLPVMTSDARKAFPKNRNPFHVIKEWTPQMLELVEIRVGDAVETTNDFTKSKSKAARYWSRSVTFSYTDPETNKEYTSGVIRMTNNDIPWINNQSYGVGFFYATCNRAIGNAIVDAATKKSVTCTMDDEKTVSNENQWWKTINKAENRIGALEKDGTFVPRNIHDIMLKTEAGIKASLDVIVKLKFNTKDGSNIKPNSQYRINFDLSRGFIRGLRNDVAPPSIEASVETAPVSKTDIATDELLDELESLGI